MSEEIEASGDIELELRIATEITWSNGEPFSSYMENLLRAVSELPDDEWEALTEDAQAWFNAACAAHNQDLEIPAFPDVEPEIPDGEEDPPTSAGSADEESGDLTEGAPDESEDSGGEDSLSGEQGDSDSANDAEVLGGAEDSGGGTQEGPESREGAIDGTEGSQLLNFHFSRWPQDTKVHVVEKGNPKRVGTLAFDKFEIIRKNSGATVGELREICRDKGASLGYAGRRCRGEWLREELRYDIKKGYVVLELPK